MADEITPTGDDTAEAYKITAVDDQGNEIVAYVKPEFKAMYVRNIASEYGNVKAEPMMIADLPDGVELP